MGREVPGRDGSYFRPWRFRGVRTIRLVTETVLGSGPGVWRGDRLTGCGVPVWKNLRATGTP